MSRLLETAHDEYFACVWQPCGVCRMKEILSHTGLRGVAALLVVLHHYLAVLDPGRVTQFFDGASACVDLFFILSGFILTALYADHFAQGVNASAVGPFILRRLARIYPLHLLTLGLMLLTILQRGDDLRPMIPEVLQNLALIHAWGGLDRFALNFPSWSISGEWAAYLAFPVLAYVLAQRGGWVLLMTLALAGYATLATLDLGLALDERLGLLRALPGFALGMCLWPLARALPSGPSKLLSLLQIGVAIAIVMLMHQTGPTLFLLPLFALLLLLTWQDHGPLARALAWTPLHRLGLWSYGIYLLHVPTRQVMYFVWPKLPVPALAPEFETLAFVSLCFLLTLLLSALSYRYFEMPARAICRQLGRGAVIRSSNRSVASSQV